MQEHPVAGILGLAAPDHQLPVLDGDLQILLGKSGHGREKGFEGLREFTTLRTLVIKHG